MRSKTWPPERYEYTSHERDEICAAGYYISQRNDKSFL